MVTWNLDIKTAPPFYKAGLKILLLNFIRYYFCNSIVGISGNFYVIGIKNSLLIYEFTKLYIIIAVYNKLGAG